MLEIAEGYEERWGIPLPEPQRFEQVWATKYAAHGDGEWYSVLHYDQQLPIPDDADFTQITEKNQSVISSEISRFITNSVDTYLGNKETQNAIQEAFNKHQVMFSIGDYYFNIGENGGNDYIMGVYSLSYKKVYLMEWHQ